MNRSLLIAILIVATAFFALPFGCGRVQNNMMGPIAQIDSTFQPTLSSIQANTFTPRCGYAPCHVAGGLAPFRLDNAAQSYANLVGVPSTHIGTRVIPNDPANSYLIAILNFNGIQGTGMPPGAGPAAMLSQQAIGQIRAWITAGAQPAQPVQTTN